MDFSGHLNIDPAASTPVEPSALASPQGHLAATRLILGLCFALSGAVALVLETVWLGQVQLVLGHTTGAMAFTLCAYLGGLLGGAFAVPRLLSRSGLSPLFYYAGAEGIVALWALGFPFLAACLAPLAPWPALAWTAAFLLLFFPAVLMGGTLPALVDHLGRRGDLGWLYTLNTAGAAVGVFSGGFLLLPSVGASGALVAAAAVGGLCVFLALLPRRHGPQTVRFRFNEGPAAPLWPLFLSGAWCLAAQIYWNRMAGLVFGPSVYIFPAVTGVLLAAFAFAAITSRRLAGFAGAWPLLAPALGALAFLLSCGVLGQGPALIFSFHEAFPQSSFAAYAAFLVLSLVVACGPGAFFLGLVFPVYAGDGDCARAAGRALAANLSGSLVGALGIMALLRWGGLSVAGLVLSAAALLSALAFLRRARAPWAALAAFAGAFAGAAYFVLPYDEALLASGAFYNRVAEGSREGQGYGSAAGFLRARFSAPVAAADDGTALVTVHVTDTGRRAFRINGKVDGGDGADRYTNQLIADLPFLIHRPGRLARALTVGLGTGATQGHVLKWPEVRAATVAELSPVVARFSLEHFRDMWLGREEDPRSSVVIADGRAHLQGMAPASLDLIIAEPSNPWVAGQASLFSEDFYRLVASKLAPGGLASLWFHSYGMPCEAVLSVFAAVTRVFPRLLVFHLNGDYFMVASPEAGEALSFDGRRAPAGWFRALGFESEAQFLSSTLVFDDEALEPVRATATANTDGNQLLQYAAGRTFYRSLMCTELESLKIGDPASRSAANAAWGARFGR